MLVHIESVFVSPLKWIEICLADLSCYSFIYRFSEKFLTMSVVCRKLLKTKYKIRVILLKIITLYQEQTQVAPGRWHENGQSVLVLFESYVKKLTIITCAYIKFIFFTLICMKEIHLQILISWVHFLFSSNLHGNKWVFSSHDNFPPLFMNAFWHFYYST